MVLRCQKTMLLLQYKGTEKIAANYAKEIYSICLLHMSRRAAENVALSCNGIIPIPSSFPCYVKGDLL